MPEFVEGEIECGCCCGIQWGGEEPRECRTCQGTGMLYRYKSGVLALYRGGPLAGRDTRPVSPVPETGDTDG